MWSFLFMRGVFYMEMPKKYHPGSIEEGKYEKWEKEGYFKSDAESAKEPFSIVIPPPNVTGKLHLGHAWDTTLQDIITRMKRMQGYEVVYLPSMDHAGIATQAKVEERPQIGSAAWRERH